MGAVRGETGSDGFFNLYCGRCGAECASGGFDRVGKRGIQLNYVCPNCGEDAVPPSRRSIGRRFWSVMERSPHRSPRRRTCGRVRSAPRWLTIHPTGR